jgi:hypothetical protein
MDKHSRLALGISIIIGSRGAATADTEGKLIFHGFVEWYVEYQGRRRKSSPSEALRSHPAASTIDYKHNIGSEENALHTDEGIGCRMVSAGKGKSVACEGKD